MKKATTLIILCLTLINCAQEKKCLNFRTGEYVYTNDMFPEKIVRNDSIQIEIHPETNVQIYTDVEWTSDCEYILTYKEIRNYDMDVSDMLGEKIYVKIIEINGNRYKAQVKSNTMERIVEFKKTN